MKRYFKKLFKFIAFAFIFANLAFASFGAPIFGLSSYFANKSGNQWELWLSVFNLLFVLAIIPAFSEISDYLMSDDNG